MRDLTFSFCTELHKLYSWSLLRALFTQLERVKQSHLGSWKGLMVPGNELEIQDATGNVQRWWSPEAPEVYLEGWQGCW